MGKRLGVTKPTERGAQPLGVSWVEEGRWKDRIQEILTEVGSFELRFETRVGQNRCRGN